MSDPSVEEKVRKEQESVVKTERAIITTLKQVRARIIMGLFLLTLSIIGVGVTNYDRAGAFTYWLFMVPIFAIVCIVYAWRATKKDEGKITVGLIRRLLLHWVGLLFFVYIIWRQVANVGLVGADEAGLFTLMLLALTTYLAGVHFDWMFMLIGAVLGVFAASAALLTQYLLIMMIPIAIIAALIIFFKFHRHEKKKEPQSADAV